MQYRFVSLFAVLSLLVAGCSDPGAANRKPVFSASGSVKLFGTPMAGATVAFAPLDGQPTALGTTDGEGKFNLTTYDFQDGAAAGKYKVVISKAVAASAKSVASGADHEAAEVAASSHDAEGAAADPGNLVPAQYGSSTETPLSAEVKSSGDNVFDFDIK